MSIPLIVTPEHEANLPSGQTVIYRPFLVKEEKLMLTIKENQNPQEIVRVMKRVVGNCVITEGFDVDTISYNDLEYLFIMMRARSVGEMAEFPIKCEKCGYEGTSEIDITKIGLSKELPKDDTVMLNSTIGVKVKPVAVDGMAMLMKSADTDPISVLHYVIDSAFNDQQVWKFSEMTQKERDEFIENLSLPLVQKIMEKVEEFPRCCIKDQVICPSCGEMIDVYVEGLENFFT